MLNRPLSISVVIPLYNKYEAIENTLNSVLQQTRAADEIIVVDDGSTDGSQQLVTEKFGQQVILIKQSNGGVSAARNHGISKARGEYIAFLDADDLWTPHYLEEVERLARQFPEAGLLATRYQYLDSGDHYVNPKIRFSHAVEQTQLMTDYFLVAARGDLPFNASTATLKKTLLENIGGFPCNEPMGEDQDVWAKAALQSSIAYSPRVLAFYNRAAQNRACESKPPQQECPFSRRLNTIASETQDAQLAQQLLDYTASHIRHLAKQNIAAGQLDAAHQLLRDPRCKRQTLKHLWLTCLFAKRSLQVAVDSGLSMSTRKFSQTLLSR